MLGVNTNRFFDSLIKMILRNIFKLQSHQEVQYKILIVWKGENMFKMPTFCLYDLDDKSLI